MPTALELKLKPGEKVLVAREIYVEIPERTPIFANWTRSPYYEFRGTTFRNAPRAEILEFNKNGIKIKYLDSCNEGERRIQEGDVAIINMGFDGFSRKRNMIQKAWDTVSYFFKKYT